MREIILKVTILSIFFGAVSCNKGKDYYHLAVYSSNNNINAVIEIPAGTNVKFEYNESTKSFEIDKKNGKNRIIQYLPYLGNYGFIPSTYSDPKKGGDGDALDVLVLSESVPTGSILEVVPLAVLKLIDDGEIDFKIIAIPVDTTKQIIKANSYIEFSRNFPEVKNIIELWFLNYNKDDKARIDGWGNEKEAFLEIENNSKI